MLLWAYLAIPVQYLWVGQEWYGMFIIFIPVYVFLFLPMVMVVIGETKDFLRAAGTLHWGMMTTVFSLSHLAFLLVLPEKGNPVGGGAGLLLYLVFLTQFNDVLQFVWGKTIGRHKIIPKVSPNKTWEGFLGGVCTTDAAGAGHRAVSDAFRRPPGADRGPAHRALRLHRRCHHVRRQA